MGMTFDSLFWEDLLRTSIQLGRTVDESLVRAEADVSEGASALEDEDFLGLRQVSAETIRAVLLNPTLTPDPGGLRLRGMFVTGVLDFDHAQLRCRLEFEKCDFDEIPTFEHATTASISLLDCKLPGLNLAFAHIAGELDMARTQVSGEVAARGVHVEGQLSMRRASLENPTGRALNLDAATVEGEILLDNGFSAIGGTHAFGIRVAGKFSMNGANLANAGSAALTLDRATFGSSVSLGYGFSSEGKVRAVGVSVAGQFSMKQATLTNVSGDALSLDGSQIAGSVFLSNGFSATGRVRAVGLRIAGQLSMKGASLNNAFEGFALDLDQAKIARDAYLHGNFTAIGGVTAEGIVVGGELVLTSAVLSNPESEALNLGRATIGSLSIDSETKFDGSMNLSFATIQAFSVGHPRSVEDLPRLNSAQGWRIGAIDGFFLNNRRSTAKWLDTISVTLPDDLGSEFAAQPWHELARNYDQAGRPEDGRWLRHEAAKRTTRIAPWTSKGWRWIYGATVGYGYYPVRVLVWVAVLWLIVFGLASANSSSFTPTLASAKTTLVVHANAKSEVVTNTGATKTPKGYPQFRPALFAIDVALPAATTGQAAAWQLTQSVTMVVFFAAIKTVSWMLAALLLAGITGILRKD
jgi:hypothetical protein